MFDLDAGMSLLFILCIISACAFEFINGFHDTANAVATVIYTNTLKPNIAVTWSAIFNFLGVFAGGIAVAMGIVDLLPVELLIEQSTGSSIAMVLALITSAIVWNFGTWYLGIPASSSHTLIGSILGVGLAFSLTPEQTFGSGVNWSKANDVGMSLLISPLFGFGATLFLMYFLSRTVKNKTIFHQPHKNHKPPLWIRFILMFTCTAVSFFHGSNDGQKGVGLVMLILIGIVPAYFALNNRVIPLNYIPQINNIENLLSQIDAQKLAEKERLIYAEILENCRQVKVTLKDAETIENISRNERFLLRSKILFITRKADKIINSGQISVSESYKNELKMNIKSLRELTDYAPVWVLLMISLSLATGTLVGWKRIVVTVGEKIGKTHMSYAQGASAEMIAASTIGLSTMLGLPVSTTHVLSSGIAGSMVAGSGIKNLQPQTVKKIVMAWILTLPVTMILSAVLFLLFRIFI